MKRKSSLCFFVSIVVLRRPGARFAANIRSGRQSRLGVNKSRTKPNCSRLVRQADLSSADSDQPLPDFPDSPREGKAGGRKQSRRRKIKAGAEGKQNPQEGIPSPRHNKIVRIFFPIQYIAPLSKNSLARFARSPGGAAPRQEPGCLELGGEAVQFCEQSFSGRGVVDGFPRSGLTIADDAVEHLEKSPDRSEVAGGHRLGGEGVRAFEAHELKQRMIGRVVELLAPQDVGDDLANPPLAHPFRRPRPSHNSSPGAAAEQREPGSRP